MNDFRIFTFITLFLIQSAASAEMSRRGNTRVGSTSGNDIHDQTFTNDDAERSPRDINFDFKSKQQGSKPKGIPIRVQLTKTDREQTAIVCNAALISKRKTQNSEPGQLESKGKGTPGDKGPLGGGKKGGNDLPSIKDLLGDKDTPRDNDFPADNDMPEGKDIPKDKETGKNEQCEFGFTTARACVPEQQPPLKIDIGHNEKGILSASPNAIKMFKPTQSDQLAQNGVGNLVAFFVKGECGKFDDSEVFKPATKPLDKNATYYVQKGGQSISGKISANGENLQRDRNSTYLHTNGQFKTVDGSPVVNEQGEFVGVVSMVENQYTGGQVQSSNVVGFDTASTEWLRKILKTRNSE